MADDEDFTLAPQGRNTVVVITEIPEIHPGSPRYMQEMLKYVCDASQVAMGRIPPVEYVCRCVRGWMLLQQFQQLKTVAEMTLAQLLSMFAFGAEADTCTQAFGEGAAAHTLEPHDDNLTTPLIVNLARLKLPPDFMTGITVRAIGKGGKLGRFDITQLTKASLLIWLRGDGGENERAENVVAMCLGHDLFHPFPEDQPTERQN